MAYDRNAPGQLRQFHLLREYKRNIVRVGFAEAKALRCLGLMIRSGLGVMLVG